LAHVRATQWPSVAHASVGAQSSSLPHGRRQLVRPLWRSEQTNPEAQSVSPVHGSMGPQVLVGPKQPMGPWLEESPAQSP
jgi:hypothetical protein